MKTTLLIPIVPVLAVAGSASVSTVSTVTAFPTPTAIAMPSSAATVTPASLAASSPRWANARVRSERIDQIRPILERSKLSIADCVDEALELWIARIAPRRMALYEGGGEGDGGGA